jgi:hypothetical protein
MQKFEVGDLYRPSEQGQGFAPITAPDITPLLRENNRARLEEAQNFANARMSDLRMEEQALKYQQLAEDEQVAGLAQFSSSLSELVVAAAEKRNEAEEQRGMMLAYTNGVDPNAAAQFDAEEAALEQGATDVNKAAGQFYQEGMPVEMVQQVQNLSGWAKYGYMRGIAEQGGANYGNFYMQAAQTLKVNVPGKEEPITLMEATTAAERAAVKSVIADQYMAQYRGMNPLLMNKYLFPKMKEWERADDLDFAQEQRDNYEAGQKAQFREGLYTAVTGQNAGQDFAKTLGLYEGLFGGSMARTKEFAFKELETLAQSKLLTPDMVEQIKKTRIINRATGRLEEIGKIFERDFAAAGLEQKYNQSLINENRLERGARDEELRQEWEGLKEANRGEDGEYDEALEEAFKVKLQREGIPIPDWFDDNNSRYDNDVEAEKKMYLSRVEQPITETELLRMHPENRRYFKDKAVADDRVLQPNKGYLKIVERQARLAANDRYGTDAIKANKTGYGHFQDRFKQDYSIEYYQAITAGKSPQEAHDIALRLVEERAKSVLNPQTKEYGSKYDKPLDTNDTRQANTDYAAAHNAIKSGASYKTTKLPGLNNAIEQLDNWVKDGKGGLPVIFHSLAYGHKGVSGWDIAKEQYSQYRQVELAREIPSRDAAIAERQAEVRDLMNHYPSSGRNARASIMDSGGSFNDPQYVTGEAAKKTATNYTTSKFRRAIITQESGGDYEILGQYVSGQGRAVGIGQVMPANIGPWTAKYYGKRLTPEEYRMNPAAQDAVLNGEFNRMLSREFAAGRSLEVAVRRAAAEWYGGPGGLENWNNPNYKGAFANHPNMAEYTMSIWRKFQGIN